jgi:hypothetical protein
MVERRNAERRFPLPIICSSKSFGPLAQKSSALVLHTRGFQVRVLDGLPNYGTLPSKAKTGDFGE